MRNLKPSVYALIAIMVVALFFGGVSLTYSDIKLSLLPILVCGLIFVLAAIELMRDLKKGKEEDKGLKEKDKGLIEQTAEEAETAVRSQKRLYILTLAWMAGLILAIYIVGFLVSIPLFIGSFLKTHGCGWFKSITLAVVTTAIFYGVFVVMLEVPLFMGVLFE